MSNSKVLLARLKETEIAPELRKVIEARIRRDAATDERKKR
jgi:hypothetical protein